MGDEALAELSIEDGLDEDKVVSEEDAAQAQKLKAEANTAFSRKSWKGRLSAVITDRHCWKFNITEQHYSEATELFTQAIRLNPRESVFFGNRAMARMKMEEYGGAVADTSTLLLLANPVLLNIGMTNVLQLQQKLSNWIQKTSRRTTDVRFHVSLFCNLCLLFPISGMC